MTTWRDYQTEADANNAPPPLGAPEHGTPGDKFNNICRLIMSVTRRLGDETPKISTVTTDGMTGETKIGTLALQNANAVNITGGSITGVAGLGLLRELKWLRCTVAQAEALEPLGWAVCDGRTVNGIKTDDLRGLFLRGWHANFNPGESVLTDRGEKSLIKTTTVDEESSSSGGDTASGSAQHRHTVVVTPPFFVAVIVMYVR